MRIVLPGGTGQVGRLLQRSFTSRGHEVFVLSRSADDTGQTRHWDGQTLGRWTEVLDGSDVVINLAGRSVNCRYTEANLAEMMDSRIASTRVIGEAIAGATRPPRVWLQMSTATIYAHTFETAHDEQNGVIGGNEPDAPPGWKRSIDIATAWEDALATAPTPDTRKVALRAAMVMAPDRGGIFDILAGLTRVGLGGPIAGGRQYMSWIHAEDFVSAINFLIERNDLSGAFNLAAPGPLPQRNFQAALRSALGVSVGLPATAWMAEIGAFFMRTDTELVFKSRRVVPGRLTAEGFTFRYPEWSAAAEALAAAEVPAT